MNNPQLNTAIALAERHALLQDVLAYPASLRREVVRKSLHGMRESAIAADLRIPLPDVRAIIEAFKEFADEQAL
jgi:hypothetical protein